MGQTSDVNKIADKLAAEILRAVAAALQTDEVHNAISKILVAEILSTPKPTRQVARRPRSCDWSKSKNQSLKATLARYLKKPDAPVPPELDAELARRFPDYNPETHTFAPTRRTGRAESGDWQNISIRALRAAVKRHANDAEFPPELDAAAKERLKNYDPATHKFTAQAPAKRITDYTQVPDNNIRTMVYYYAARPNVEFPQGLNEEAARRFPGYDPTTHKFKKLPRGGKKESGNWADMADGSLRSAIKRHINDAVFPPELDAEAARRFKRYDPKTHTFGQGQNQDWSTLSDAAIRANIGNYKTKKKLPIPPELNAEAARRFPGYDPETHTFCGRRAPKPQSKKKPGIDWAAMSTQELYKAIKQHAKDDEFPPELDAEAKRRFVTYNSQTHTIQPAAPQIAPAPQPIAKKPAAAYDDDTDNMPTETDAILMDTAEDFDPYQLMGHKDNTPAKTTAKPIAQSANKILTASVVPVTPRKDAADQTIYNNIVVNGQVIVKKHLDTKIRTFLDGTYLGIHGCWVRDTDWPDRHQWLIYNTQLERLPRFIGRRDQAGRLPIISQIGEQPDHIKLVTSAKPSLVIELRKKKNIIDKFKINDEESR